MSWTKEQTRAYNKQYREKNKEKLLEYDRLRYKTRYIARKQADPLYQSRQYHNNKEYYLEYQRQYRKQNPDKSRAHVENRRARKLNAPGKYTEADIQVLFLSQSGLCVSCHTKLDQYRVDHIFPLSRGGSNYPENIQLLCPSCNSSKGNKTMEEFVAIKALKEKHSGR